MKNLLSDLFPDQKLVEVRPDDALVVAMTKMLCNDFSQIPVLNDDGHPLGMITWHSIVRALNAPHDVKTVKVQQVMLTAFRTVQKSSHFLDILPLIREHDFVVVLDGEIAASIITSTDVAVAFQQWMEPLVFIEKLESDVTALLDRDRGPGFCTTLMTN